MKVDLHAQVTLADVHRAAIEFLRWWRGELFDLLPVPWRSALSAWRRRIVLRRDHSAFGVVVDGNEIARFDMARADDASFCDELAKTIPELFSLPVDVALSSEDVLIRRIQLPDAAVARVRSTLALQIERLSPFKSGDASFDCRVVDHDEGEHQSQVEVCIVPRRTMQQLEAQLQSVGLSVDGFVVEGTPYRLSSQGGQLSAATRKRLTLGASAVAALFWLGVIVFLPVARETETEALTQQIAELRPEARRAAALREELVSLRDPVLVATMKAASPAPVDILKLLTNTLPDSVRVLELTIVGSQVRIVGIAPSANSVIAVLQKSGPFSAVRLRIPAQRQPSGRERFDIEMSVSAATARAGAT